MHVNIVHVYAVYMCIYLFWSSGKSSAMQVECYAADGSLMSRDDGGRFLYVSQVHQGHGACLQPWVGQQSIVGAGAETA